MRKQPSIWFTLFMVICISLSLVLAACGETTVTSVSNTTPATKSTEPATTPAARKVSTQELVDLVDYLSSLKRAGQ